MKINFKIFLIIISLILTFQITNFADEKYEINILVGEKIDLDSFLIENEGVLFGSTAKWTSSNKEVLDVDNSGVIKGIRSGKAYVYVSLNEGFETSSAIVRINVISMVKDFSIINDNAVINIGETYKIPYDISSIDGYDEINNDKIKWTSNRPEIASVDTYGLVEGLKKGFVIIDGYTEDGNYHDSIKIEVLSLKDRISIDNGAEKIKLKVGQTHNFIAKSGDIDLTSTLKWEARISNLLTIDDNGVAEAIRPGTLMVKASTKDENNYDYIQVEIVSMVKDFILDKTNYKFDALNQDYAFQYEIVPAINGENPIVSDVVWKSSDSSIVSINSDGIMTSVKPGVVKITATTKDGDFQDSCSVRVDGVIETLRDVFVQDFIIEDFPKEVITGEEIFIDLKYYPRHATKTKFTYNVKKGPNSQIKTIGDEVYFIPTVIGNNEIVIKSESEIEKILKIKVKSPINGIEISNEIRNLYLGEKRVLDFEFKLKKGYEYSDIFLSTSKWTSSDSNIVSIKEVDDEYILEANGIGKAEIILKADDGGYTDKMRIEVKSPIFSINLKDDMVFFVNEENELEKEIRFKNNLDYDLDEKIFEDKYEYTIEKAYVKSSYVKNEINFENEFIKELQKSVVANPNFSSKIYSEINIHKDRLKTLNLILNSDKNGFCFLPENKDVKDRLNENIKVATIKDNKIIGEIAGKVEIKISLKGSKLENRAIVFFKNLEKPLFILNENGDVVSFNNDMNKDALLKGEVALAMKINDRYKDLSLGDIPSNEYISDVLFLEDKDCVPEAMKKGYKNDITREQLAEISNKIYEYIVGEKIKNIEYSAFADTSNLQITKAYNMGFVSSDNLKTFSPNKKATNLEIIEGINGIIRVSKISSLDYMEKISFKIYDAIENMIGEEGSISVEKAISIFSKLIK